MYCFESKYALCLYEMIERRIGLAFKQKEEFTIELRGLLNVPPGKARPLRRSEQILPQGRGRGDKQALPVLRRFYAHQAGPEG